MPFKLRLKKSRCNYDFVSKNVFVVSVELLDKAVVECSLSSDSHGQECLENVCQRIGLHQSEFFGLRFASKWRQRSTRWLELEKPLKRQLDKYASHGHDHGRHSELSLGVMYYVGDVALLFDEVARYHYFLQLKSDIVDGRIQCNADQAVVLAAYCLQAEFGNHDSTRHTFEYLSDFPLLPKNLCLDAPNLLSKVIATHRKMVGLVPAAAEQNYIQSAQQLNDYGVEYYPAKDGDDNVLLGVSVVGVFIVKHQSATDRSLTFKWSCIVNLSNHKRCVIVEHETPDSASASRSAQFQMEDSDTAKYVWRLCVLQHKFYMRTRSVVRSNECSTVSDADAADANWRSISMPNLQSYVGYETVSSSCGALYTLHSRHQHGDPRANEYLTISSGAISELHYEEAEVEEDDVVDPSYPSVRRPYVDVVHRGKCEFKTMDLPSPTFDNLDGSRDHLNDVWRHHKNQYHEQQQQQQQQQQQHQLNAEQLSSNRAAQRLPNLPAYRPAPDYDTAVRKYGTVQVAPVTSHLTQIMPLIPSSNGVVVLDNPLMSKSYSHYKNFADLSRADGEPRLNQGREQVSAVGTPTSYDHLVHMISPGTPRDQGVVSFEAVAADAYFPFVDDHHRGTYGFDMAVRTSDNLDGLRNLVDVRRVHQQRPSASTPDLFVERLSLGQQHDAISRSVVDDATTMSAVVQNKESEINVSPGFQFVRQILPSVVSSLDSKRSRPKELSRSRSNSTQSAPDPACSAAFVVDRTVGSISKEKPMGNSQSQFSMAKTDLCNTTEDSRAHVFEYKLSEGSLFAEFAAIPRRRPIQAQIDLDCATALLSENASRNRFAVLPYDDNRVHLSFTVDNPKGYINASHLSMWLGDLERRSYVAAQGPLSSSAANDFWRMVWELDARVVVMLTNVRDGRGADKCFQYWPDESDMANTSLQFRDLQVVRRFGVRSTSFVTSSLVLSDASLPKNVRNVWHIQYVDWPDHGCPDVSGFLGFMDEIESLVRQDGQIAPIIVHCTAGVGRTGVTILSDVMIHSLKHNMDLDVPKVLAHLRHQRMLFVQTLAQYKFVYAVLVQYLKNSRLI